MQGSPSCAQTLAYQTKAYTAATEHNTVPASRNAPGLSQRNTMLGSQAWSHNAHHSFARHGECRLRARPARRLVINACHEAATSPKLAKYPPYQPRTALFRPTSRIHSCSRPTERQRGNDTAWSHQHACTCSMRFLNGRCSDSLRKFRNQTAHSSMKQQNRSHGLCTKQFPAWNGSHGHLSRIQSSDTVFCTFSPRFTPLSAHRHAIGRKCLEENKHGAHDCLRAQVQCSGTHRDVEIIRELLEGC